MWRDHGKVRVLEKHHVEIKLGSSYPRTIPEIRWLTPVYHPNISEIGMVCLGGYGTHWVPSVQLDELCTMLWDMLRYHNYDIRSPYNRDAALWVAQQQTIRFPTDARPLRDLRAALGRVATAAATTRGSPSPAVAGRMRIGRTRRGDGAGRPGRVRGFAQRYGRVFGAAAGGAAAATAEPAEAPGRCRPTPSCTTWWRPRRPRRRRMTRRSAGEPVFILEPEPPAETGRRRRAARGGGRRGDPAPVRPAVARPARRLRRGDRRRRRRRSAG